MKSAFVHLHIHSEYSVVNGMLRLGSLVEESLQQQAPAVALTDLSNLYGAVKFYSKCVAKGIKPIIGAEITLDNPDKVNQPYILVLLVQNAQGYANLSKLLSVGYQKGQANGRPEITKQWIAEHSEGLLCLSGAMRGDLGTALLSGRPTLAKSLLDDYLQMFPGRFYIEIQRIGKDYEEEYIASAARLAAQHGVPLVATNDVYFMHEHDYDVHEVRVCINEGRVLNDPRRTKHHTPAQFLKSGAAMEALFVDLPSAIENTTEIAKRCNFEMRMGEYFLPDFPIPPGFNEESFLRDQSYQNLDRLLERRFAQGPSPAILEEYRKRMDYELEVILEMGFPGYFLIVADFIQWAKQNDVPVGPGRGSGAGSLVAYALGITDIDPIEHQLLFERFLNPERISMPDFDVDFCIEGRERVIEYVANKYGRNKVSQIITFGTMGAKGVIRDVGRVLGMSYGHVDGVAKLIPNELNMTLSLALEKEPELRGRYESEEEITELINTALKLEGLTRNVGKHAGGVVIAPTDLTDFTPLYCERDSEQIVSQFDKDDLEAIGLVKFDFLGLRNLTIIDMAVKAINATRPVGAEPLCLERLSLDDAATYNLLKRGLTTAIFQLESPGMKELIKNLQPSQFNDIVALLALYRPGPLRAGMEKIYCDRKFGREPTSYLDPMLEPVLKETFGVILYQEQVMEIARLMAGYSLGTADILRRAMGKKKAAEMAEQREIFERGAVERGVSAAAARTVFDHMENFAEYGFNKSHSAAYAIVAYQTAWLKAHYPAHFMAACMSAEMEHTDKVVVFLNESAQLGLVVEHPDINRCEYHFKAHDDTHIVYGLGAIKGIGRPVIEAIITARTAGGHFKDLYDLCARVDGKRVNRRALEALIKSGALDELGVHRASLMASVDLALDAANQQHRSRAAGQDDMFGIMAPAETVQVYQNVAPWQTDELLNAEKETLGLYLSGHPIDAFADELKQFTTCRLIDVDVGGFGANKGRTKTPLTLAGLVVGARVINTKTGARMAILQLDDKSARMEITVFGELFDERREVILKDKVLVVKGKASHDHFNDRIRVSAEELFDIEQARTHLSRCLRIRLQGASMTEEKVAQLRTLLEHNELGQCSVELEYLGANGFCRLAMTKPWRIVPDPLTMEKLDELVGQSNLTVIY